MNEILETLIFYLVFWIGAYLVGKIFKTHNKGLIVKPLYLNYKTTSANNFLKRISKKGRKFWLVAWNVGAAIAFGQMAFITYTLLKNIYFLTSKVESASQVFLLLPGLTVSWGNIPYLLASLAILLITHEFAHGIASLVEGVPLKSAGVFILAFLPGGFVEVDEETLKKTKAISRLRVFAAGSTANLAVGLAFLILMANFGISISPFYSPSPSGVLITGLVKGGAAERVGLTKWDAILALNDVPIKDVEALTKYMNSVRPNSVIKVTTLKGEFRLVTQPHKLNKTKALIGIYPFNYHAPKFSFLPNYLPYYIFIFENWAYTILISVALINMLPIYPLDGGKILETLLDKIGIKRIKEVQIAASLIFASILGLNLILSSLVFGIIRL